MKPDQRYMKQCLDLARGGYGRVHPNPMVGAVLVKNGRVISTGFHQQFGGAHAERDCLRKAGRAARGATLYVNLEPCIHHGKTPPCADAIIEAGVAGVVVAMKDPNPRVRGRGISALRRAGISVTTGLVRDEAVRLNERFIWWHTKGIPFVGLKWAQTLDGYVADTRGRSAWITGSDARRYVHVLRSGYHSILVGAGTVIKDDPLLTVRHVPGTDPVRIVLDGRLRVRGDERLFRIRTGRTIVLTSQSRLRSSSAPLRRLLANNVDVMGAGKGKVLSVRTVLRVLSAEGITSVLVEGGPDTIGRFFAAGAYNAYYVFVRSSLLGGGLPALPPNMAAKLPSLEKTKGRDLYMFEGGDLMVEGGAM